jgi:hypothetical protein
MNHYSDEFLAKFPGCTTRLTSIEQFVLLDRQVPSVSRQSFALRSPPPKPATGTQHEAHWTKDSLKVAFLILASFVSKDVPSQCTHFDVAMTISP